MADKTTRLSKSKQGYGYKYTELAQINELLESRGESYYQYTETFNGKDYIMTVKIDKDGNESKPIRGCEIISGDILQGKSNPAQQMGSSITYSRRYSLLMAYGLATEDDDAEAMTGSQRKQGRQPQQPQRQAKREPADMETQKSILDIVNKYSDKNLMDQVRKRFHINSVDDLDKETAAQCLTMLKQCDAAWSISADGNTN